MLGKVRYRKHTKYVILYKENLEVDHKKEQNLKENKKFPHCVTSVYITIPFFQVSHDHACSKRNNEPAMAGPPQYRS